MNNATYYRKPVSVVSPYQPKPQHPIELMRAKVYDLQDKTNPIRATIEQCLGTHTITAVIEEDMQTISTMGVDGLVSFLCTLSENGRTLSQGRGSVVLSPTTNRFIQKAVACAFNASIADAALRASRVLDMIRDKTGTVEETNESDPATVKQLEYIRQLVQANVKDPDTLSWWMNSINGGMTKDDASRAIKNFVKN